MIEAFPTRVPLRSRALAAAIGCALLAAACGDGPSEPPQRQRVIVVQFERTGNGNDADGVVVTSGSNSWRLALDSTLVLRDAAQGSHSFVVSDLAGHCYSDVVQQSVHVGQGDSVTVRFPVECFGDFAYALWFSPGLHQIRYVAENGTDTALTNTHGAHLPRDWSPDGSMLAFSSAMSGNDDVYTVRTDGTGLHSVSNHPHQDIYPRWSPDGQWITWTRFENWGLIEWSAIYVARPDGSDARVVVDQTAIDFHSWWSPTGTHLVFQSDRAGAPGVVTMRPDGSDFRLHGGVHPIWPAWSPDGARISYVDFVGDVQDGWIVRLDGSARMNISNRGYVGSVAWSPDGMQALFTSGAPGTDIFRVNADGTGVLNLTNSLAYDGAPSWSPDGARILFASDRDGRQDLHIMTPDGGRIRRLRLSTNDAVVFLVLWNPNARPGTAPAPSTMRTAGKDAPTSSAMGAAGHAVRAASTDDVRCPILPPRDEIRGRRVDRHAAGHGC